MKQKNLSIAAALALSMLVSPWPASAAVPHWTHEDQSDWGQLQDTEQTSAPQKYPFAECSLGIHQSPIDLSSNTLTRSINQLNPKYIADTPDFFNTGHAAQVNTSNGYRGILKIGRDEYPLIQYHIHLPSEHVNGSTTYAGELHFVHIRPDGRIAVLAVLLQEGRAHPGMQTILENEPIISGVHNSPSGTKLNPKIFLPADTKHFFTYAGSLTTPPCSEGVNWYVLMQPIQVSKEQIDQLATLYNHNNRLPQPENGRIAAKNFK